MKPSLTLSANAILGRGGQGLNLQHMVEALEEDFQVNLFCRQGISNGVLVNSVPPSARANMLGRIPFLRRLRDWQTWCSEVDFDGHVAGALTRTSLFQGVTGQSLKSLQVARRLGAGVILDVVTTHVDFFGEQLDRECGRFGVRPPLSAGMRQRMRQEYRQADALRVMSEVAKQSFLRKGFPEERLFVAPPPFSLAEFPVAGFHQAVFRVCFVGLIEPWKGFHYLIEAFNQLDHTDSELVLWGGPGARPIIRYLNEQQGRNPRIQVRPVEVRQAGLDVVYGQSHVLVLPSLSDGFGYVVGEAMACGIPVIVTTATGAADLVREGENGYLVPPRDAEAIRDRLDHLARNPALVRAMGLSARETMKSFTASRFRSTLMDHLRPWLS